MTDFISGKMSSKGQLTIPSELREKWGLEEGDRLKFELDDQGQVKSVSPYKKKSVKDLFGVIKADKKIEMQEAREIYQDEAAKKLKAEMDGDN
ncbi:AbrB family looped-hinge helix DNA binding protein [Paenibacillus mucilaginosus]|uniref:AbrB/MazE/SpoVT family DNA-binding domain-containing protein n=1 Tax=Paenibacillus mucilaginosus TaxID=61624 RepID=UPI003D257B92